MSHAQCRVSRLRFILQGANSPGATKYAQPVDSKATNAYLMPTPSKRPGGGAKPKKVAGPKKTAGPQQPKKTKKEAASPVYAKPNKTKKAAGRAQAGKAAAAGPPKKKKAAKQQQEGRQPPF